MNSNKTFFWVSFPLWGHAYTHDIIIMKNKLYVVFRRNWNNNAPFETKSYTFISSKRFFVSVNSYLNINFLLSVMPKAINLCFMCSWTETIHTLKYVDHVYEFSVLYKICGYQSWMHNFEMEYTNVNSIIQPDKFETFYKDTNRYKGYKIQPNCCNCWI